MGEREFDKTGRTLSTLVPELLEDSPWISEEWSALLLVHVFVGSGGELLRPKVETDDRQVSGQEPAQFKSRVATNHGSEGV